MFAQPRPDDVVPGEGGAAKAGRREQQVRLLFQRRQPGEAGTASSDTFFVEVYSQDSTSDLSDFFTSELPKNGWTESLTTESNGEVYLSFAPESGDTSSGVTIAITESQVEGYRLVSISMFGG